MAGIIYLITGIMASGKSTVAEVLARRMGKSVHLHGDVFRKMIVSGREDMSAAPSAEALRQLDMRYRIAAAAARMYAAEGFTVILQDNYYGEKLLYMTDLLAGCIVRTVVLCPTAEAVRSREAQRGKTGYTGFTVDSLHASFMSGTPRVGFWIDNSNMTPEETADRILAHYGKQDRQ